MHKRLVSFLIISLTMFLLCTGKVKRLALKEKVINTCGNCILTAKAKDYGKKFSSGNKMWKNIEVLIFQKARYANMHTKCKWTRVPNFCTHFTIIVCRNGSFVLLNA